MPPIYGLSSEDRDKVQQVITLLRGLGLTHVGQLRAPSDKFWLENLAVQAPEIYVAKTPTGGIPAMDQAEDTGTGTGTVDLDSPGSADCDIYRIEFATPTSSPTLVAISGLTRTVYNLTNSAITDEWVLAHKDKWGFWCASAGGGGVSCTSQNCIHDITLIGSPQGGSFDLDYTINSTTETLTFNYDDDSTEVGTELETHSEIASGDVAVTAGPFPDATMRVEFQGNLANTDIALPTADWGSLNAQSGTASPLDGTGLGVVVAKAQLGVA
jgi:hypothetical protein